MVNDKNLSEKKYLSVSELAQLLGVSRVAIFKRIKNGQIRAERIGRMLAIPREEFRSILGEVLTPGQKQILNKAVAKTIKEYGKTLRLLGSS